MVDEKRSARTSSKDHVVFSVGGGHGGRILEGNQKWAVVLGLLTVSLHVYILHAGEFSPRWALTGSVEGIAIATEQRQTSLD